VSDNEPTTQNQPHNESQLDAQAEANRYNTLGISQATQNMLQQAIVSFSKAIEFDPSNPGYWYNRGISYANDVASGGASGGALTMAIEDFTQALTLRGDDADILNNRGSVYAMLGELDKALTDLTLCIELNPNQPEPYNTRAAVLAQKGDYVAATIDFSRAIALKPQYAEAHFNLARVNALMGRCDLASAHLKEAITFQPTYKQVARVSGDFDVCKGKPEFTAI
jgi:Flp pilus assembly protein TadD